MGLCCCEEEVCSGFGLERADEGSDLVVIEGGDSVQGRRMRHTSRSRAQDARPMLYWIRHKGWS